jgi:hypothetical protein
MLSLNQIQLIKNCFNVRSDIQKKFNNKTINEHDIKEYMRIANILESFKESEIFEAIEIIKGGF